MARNCFVPGCKSIRRGKRKKPDEKPITLFSAPKDPVLRKRWHIASRRADKEMNEKHVMCELHFTEDCIEKYFTTDMGWGEIFVLERERKRLKKGSIPTIFSFNQSDSTSRKGRPKKQNKENGSGNFELKKKPSPSKVPTKVLSCSAYGCSNSSDMKVSGLTFHRFPTNRKRRSKWIRAVGREDWQPSGGSVLCSDHFTSDQIEQLPSSVRLKPGAVPTIFSSGEEQPSEDSDEEAVCDDADYFVQEEKSPSNQLFSDNFIVEGHEEVFGKFVASELKILSCDPLLHLRTKQKIWQVLEEASQMHAT